MIRRLSLLCPLLAASAGWAASPGPAADFPRALSSYADPAAGGVMDIILARAAAEPLNVVATAIFFLAVLHTFLTPRIRHWGHVVEERHRARLAQKPAVARDEDGQLLEVSFGGQVLHFFGEVETVFGIWAVVLGLAIIERKGVEVAAAYLGDTVNYTEATFVVIIMAMASTRPVMRLAENSLRVVASLGGGGPVAWWLSILTIAPLLGSFITEPAAMTIAALLLGKQFYALKPSPKLCYATLGLLFVNISIGGTLTHFAAPPVLMVAAAWGWDMAYMFTHFGWHALTGILLSNAAYFFIFRQELRALTPVTGEDRSGEPVPVWVTLVHLLFLAFTVLCVHRSALFVGGFLFFLAFAQATRHHQNTVELRNPLLVGFFLAGLVIHGGLQGWWIAPVLGSLGKLPLFGGAVLLTAFNDNALITYLATLVPDLTEGLKFAVVAGAVTGGGLTVIANAPNPAGQAILQRYFPEGISPLGLLLGALLPTLLVSFSFLFL